jgi:hypothetical protein
MPKPLTMTIAVEELHFGKVFRTLNSMPGVAAIQIGGEAVKPKSNGGYAASNNRGTDAAGTSAICLVLNALSIRAQTKKELDEALGKYGKKATTPITKLTARRMVVRKGRGLYAITPAGKKHFAENCKKVK